MPHGRRKMLGKRRTEKGAGRKASGGLCGGKGGGRDWEFPDNSDEYSVSRESQEGFVAARFFYNKEGNPRGFHFHK